MHKIYITGSNKYVLQKMQENGFNVTTCGDCGGVKLHEIPVKSGELKCDYCGFESDICDFPDLTTVEARYGV